MQKAAFGHTLVRNICITLHITLLVLVLTIYGTKGEEVALGVKGLA